MSTNQSTINTKLINTKSPKNINISKLMEKLMPLSMLLMSLLVITHQFMLMDMVVVTVDTEVVDTDMVDGIKLDLEKSYRSLLCTLAQTIKLAWFSLTIKVLVFATFFSTIF